MKTLLKVAAVGAIFAFGAHDALSDGRMDLATPSAPLSSSMTGADEFSMIKEADE
jgi:hypothetical protein